MRKRVRTCPLCGVRLTARPNLPNSKHLDHIIPVAAGGTHTHGNVRIICAACNLRRPKDGSDYSGPVTLWAQGPVPVGRPDRRRTRLANITTCRKGLHPWTPENIVTAASGRRLCRACRLANERRNSGAGMCECGAPLTTGGRTAWCAACAEAVARKAAELHAAGGLTWNQVAALVGYGTGEGARFAARRTGYVAAVRPALASMTEKRCECGALIPAGDRGANRARCDECIRSGARRAVHLRTQEGWTLRMIADELGYRSITSVTNLMKTIMPIESRMGRPSILQRSDLHKRPVA